jgi:CheY-like chemotaxis protein
MSQLPQTRTILVAEDSEVTRTLVTGILSNLGYRIIQAEDGQQAWEMLQNYRVDLLMTDIQMPRMSGLELLESVRADPALEDIPVIMLSTLGSAADKEYAMRLGADAYLVKLDFREKELVSTVRRYLKR